MPSFERWVVDSKVEERIKRDRLSGEEDRRRERRLLEGVEAGGGYGNGWRSRMERKNQNPGRGDSDGDEGAVRLMHVTSTGKNPTHRYDPVIPSMPDDKNDGASQRLLSEMMGTNHAKDGRADVEKERNKRKAIVKELCRRACEASREVQSLNSRLGGGVEAEKYFMAGTATAGDRHKKSKKAKSQNSLGRIVLELATDDHLDPDNLKQAKATERLLSLTDPSIQKTHTTYSLSYSRKIKNSYDADKGDRKMKPFHVKINAAHYEKLRGMFHSVHNHSQIQQSASQFSPQRLYTPPITAKSKSSDHHTPATNIFHHLVFCVLVRYASLSGGQQLKDLRGGGMQGAIHSQVFDFLSNSLTPPSPSSLDNPHDIMECFASPLNAYSPYFCSAFHKDLDRHFGSRGDFFSVPIGSFASIGHVHEANPPFAPGLMESMVGRMEDHLRFADSLAAEGGTRGDNEGNGRLTFIVVVPSCGGGREGGDKLTVMEFARNSFRSMQRSPYFVKHLVLKAREHGYVEASQHVRPTRYKESQYDTSVFILQSDSARKYETDDPKLTSDEVESGLREAFKSRHLQELNERRSREANVIEEKMNPLPMKADESVDDNISITKLKDRSKVKNRKKKKRKV